MSEDVTRPGDRWQHSAWPVGTPDAVVERVEGGVVTWGQRGGAEAPTVGHAYAERLALRQEGVAASVVGEMTAEEAVEELAWRRPSRAEA